MCSVCWECCICWADYQTLQKSNLEQTSGTVFKGSLKFLVEGQLILTCRENYLNWFSNIRKLSSRWSNQTGNIILTTGQCVRCLTLKMKPLCLVNVNGNWLIHTYYRISNCKNLILLHLLWFYVLTHQHHMARS